MHFQQLRKQSQAITLDNILADESFQELIPTILTSIYEGFGKALQQDLIASRWNFPSAEMYEYALSDFGQEDFLKHWDANFAIKTIEDICYGIVDHKLEMAIENWIQELAEELEPIFAEFIAQNVAKHSADFDYISIIYKQEFPKQTYGYFEIYLDRSGSGKVSVYDRSADQFVNGFFNNVEEFMQFLSS